MNPTPDGIIIKGGVIKRPTAPAHPPPPILGGAPPRDVAPNEGMRRFLTIHRFAHQSGRGERSGGLSAAKFRVFSARVFLYRSQNP